MNNFLTLSPEYSTTRWLTRTAPSLVAPMGSKLARILRLPAGGQLRGEGGLRTQGYFKSGPGADEVGSAPLITVITVVFNAAATLEQTIQSVLRQNYSNVEFIIIDGGSTDGTLDILRKYEHALDYWASEPDKGIYDAWNKSVALSSGQWIGFLGADDIYLEGALAAYAGAISAANTAPLDYISSRVNLTRGASTIRVIGKRWSWREFAKYMNVAHVGSLHHRRLFETFGTFDLAYRICGDYEFLLRPGAALRAEYIDRVTVNMAIGGVSDSNWRALPEMTRAKIRTGGRHPVLGKAELAFALLKWKIRRWVWY